MGHYDRHEALPSCHPRLKRQWLRGRLDEMNRFSPREISNPRARLPVWLCHLLSRKHSDIALAGWRVSRRHLAASLIRVKLPLNAPSHLDACDIRVSRGRITAPNIIALAEIKIHLTNIRRVRIKF